MATDKQLPPLPYNYHIDMQHHAQGQHICLTAALVPPVVRPSRGVAAAAAAAAAVAAAAAAHLVHLALLRPGARVQREQAG
jgi:hypothetical protein